MNTSCDFPWSAMLVARFIQSAVTISRGVIVALIYNLVMADLHEASCDYCHAPLGVSSFSFSIQNVWEMTTVVDKIACRSCTACPPPIVLRLFIADTIGFTMVYS